MQRQRTGAAVLFLAAVVAIAAAQAASAAPPRYSVLKIGDALTAGTHPLNDLGQVAGTSPAPGNTSNAFLTQPNSSFVFPTDLIAGTGSGLGVNNLGQVVGDYPVGQGRSNGYRTRPGQPFDPAIDGVGTLGHDSHAEAINNLGQVTGRFEQAYRLNMGETITGGKLIGTLGGSTSAGRDINDLGQIVGDSLIAGDQFTHAFRTAPNAKINPLTDDLGTLGGNQSFAKSINASGMVVGLSHVNVAGTIRHAYRTAPNQAINPFTDDLGTLGGILSSGSDINDAGWVVGTSTIDPANPNSNHAFVFDGTAMWDLNDLVDLPGSLPLAFARGINNAGQILADTNFNLYLLTPMPVPEPATGALAAVTFVVMFGFARHHRRGAQRNRERCRILQPVNIAAMETKSCWKHSCLGSEFASVLQGNQLAAPNVDPN